ncbi:MAG: ion channel [Hyphomicrobiaceae bacterium]|nr:ion channel [Hyphomicrobiaceae bacterium]
MRKDPTTARELILLASSLLLVALVAISVARGPNLLFVSIVLTAAVSTAVSRWLFPAGSFFSLTFANLIAVYATIFAFFMDELYPDVGDTAAGVAFSLPVAGFLAGSWLRRGDISSVVDHPRIGTGAALYRALIWLIPVFLVGTSMFVLSTLAESLVNSSTVLLCAMLAIALIVLAVAHNVARFLVDAGLLFDEFMQRMSRLAVPAFAFLTFYSMLVIVFGSIYAMMSQFSHVQHFHVGGVARALSHQEAIYLSVATISTVGYGDIVPASNLARVLTSVEVLCGVILLLFGVSELLEYTREHQRLRVDRSKHL